MKSPIRWAVALAILFFVFAVRITDKHALEKQKQHTQKKVDKIEKETTRCKRKCATHPRCANTTKTTGVDSASGKPSKQSSFSNDHPCLLYTSPSPRD